MALLRQYGFAAKKHQQHLNAVACLLVLPERETQDLLLTEPQTSLRKQRLLYPASEPMGAKKGSGNYKNYISPFGFPYKIKRGDPCSPNS